MLSLLHDGAITRRCPTDAGPSLLARLARAVADSARSRRALRELEGLSPRMLRDIGIEPDSIFRDQ